MSTQQYQNHPGATPAHDAAGDRPAPNEAPADPTEARRDAAFSIRALAIVAQCASTVRDADVLALFAAVSLLADCVAAEREASTDASPTAAAPCPATSDWIGEVGHA